MMRLDKFLSNNGIGSRKEVKTLLSKGLILVNDTPIKDASIKINEEQDIIKVNGEIVKFKKYHYYMLNKPKGLVTSTKDKLETVMSLIKEYPTFNLSPVGRLDIDTEGLLLICDDGPLTHLLTSPKHHISKTYLVKLLNSITKEDISQLEKGITLDDGYKCMPGIVEQIDEKTIKLTIFEGKFHQVKRMMIAIGNKVEYLKRISFGPLILDDTMPCASYRELTKEEEKSLEEIKKSCQMT